MDLAHTRGFVAAEIRALNNLAVSMDDDPRRALETLELSVSLARRVGNRSLANWAAISRLYTTFLMGEGWDEALAEAEQDLADALAHAVASPLDEIRSLSVQGTMRVARGESTDATLARLEALAEQTSDAYGAAAVHFLRGDRALLAGEHADACREMLLAADEPNVGDTFLVFAVRAAMWGRDVVKAREIADRLDAHPSSAAPTATGRIAARAGIAALEGRRGDAIAGYGDALARYRATGQDFALACAGLDCVLLVGAEEPSARAAGKEARTIFERVEARPYLRLLESAVARDMTDARPARAGDRQAVSGPPA